MGGSLAPLLLQAEFQRRAEERAAERQSRRQVFETVLPLALAGETVPNVLLRNLTFQQAQDVQEIARLGKRRQQVQQATQVQAAAQDIPGQAPQAAQLLTNLMQQFGPGAVRQVQQDLPTEVLRARGQLPEQLGQAAMESTQFERLIGHLPPERQALLKEAMAARQATGGDFGGPTFSVTQPDGTTITFSPRGGQSAGGLTGKQRNDIVIQALDLQNSLGLVSEMVNALEQSETRAGFARTLGDALRGGAGLLAGIDQATGANVGRDLAGLLQSQFEKDVESGRIDATHPVVRAVFDQEVAETDLERWLLAFALERATTGGRRFSIEAVQRFYNELNLSQLAPGAALTKLRRVERVFRRRLREQEALARSNNIPIPQVDQPRAPTVIDLRPDGTLPPEGP